MCLFTTCQAKNLLSTGWFVKLGMFFFMIMVMIRSVIIEAGGSSCLSNSTRIFLHSCITGESERATKQISVNNNKKNPKKSLNIRCCGLMGVQLVRSAVVLSHVKPLTLLIVLQYMDDNIVVVIFVWYQVEIYIDFNL